MVEKFNVANDNGYSADAVRELYRLIRANAEDADGQWGSDVLETLGYWFTEHGFDVEGPNIPRLVQEHGESLVAFVENFGSDFGSENLEDAYQESYQGTYSSPEEWAREQAEEVFGLEGVALNYFDAEAFARDARLGGEIYFAETGSWPEVHVFRYGWW